MKLTQPNHFSPGTTKEALALLLLTLDEFYIPVTGLQVPWDEPLTRYGSSGPAVVDAIVQASTPYRYPRLIIGGALRSAWIDLDLNAIGSDIIDDHSGQPLLTSACDHFEEMLDHE